MKEHRVRCFVGVVIVIWSSFVVSCATTSSTPDSSSVPKAAPAPALVGYGGVIERVDCDVISGWLWATAQPDSAQSLEIYIDDKVLSEVKAATPRPDLRDAKVGTGNYGFSYSVPADMKDGNAHTVKIKVQNTDYEMEFYKDTPRSFSCEVK